MLQLHEKTTQNPFRRSLSVHLANLKEDGASEAFERDLRYLKSAWKRYRSCRNRSAIYGFLDATFRTAKKWGLHEKIGAQPAEALRGRGDPVAEMIRSVSNGSADRRTACKWSRAIRYALSHKRPDQRLEQFMLSKGGVNSCADEYRS